MASNANESYREYLERIALLPDPRPCEHIWEIDEHHCLKCVRCKEPHPEPAGRLKRAPMKIDVYRFSETDRSILGRVQIDRQQFCFSLEPSRLTPVHAGHPCIPAGLLYRVVLTMSPHFGYVTPELMGVPGRTAIRIHKGNKPEDSLGCTLVGTSHGPAADWISDSHAAFDQLMERCRTAESRTEGIFIEYYDLPKADAQQGTAKE
jgi:hypothetical protein